MHKRGAMGWWRGNYVRDKKSTRKDSSKHKCQNIRENTITLKLQKYILSVL